MHIRLLAVGTALAIFQSSSCAQLPPLDTPPASKTVTLDLTEGTWMSLDVSPDGKTIAFDLLNDIYMVPSTGGTATAIHRGSPAQRSPQFSPDGQSLVYLSDETGADNVWVSRPDGSNPAQITHETHAFIAGPAWAPDGKSIAAVLTYSDIFRVRNSEIHQYTIDGSSDQLIVEPRESGKDVQEPRYAPNGTDLYFTERIAGDHYVYMNTGLKNFAINRLDLVTGDITRTISGYGGATTPQVSPDGNSVAFIRRLGAKTVLFVKFLDTGEERPIFQELGRDLQGDYLPQEHYYPAFDWFPDSRTVAIWAKGKLLKIDTQTAEATEIPFHVESVHEIQPAIRVRQDLAPEMVDVRTIRQLAFQPNGTQLVYRALGKIWQTDRSVAATPARVTEHTTAESSPSYSPDGSKLAYVSWNDETGSQLIVREMETGTEQIVTSSPAVLADLHFSNSGNMIAFRIQDADTSVSAAGPETGIYMVDAKGGAPTFVAPGVGLAGFSPDDTRLIYFAEPAYYQQRAAVLASVTIDGSDVREHAIAETSDVLSMTPSPDLKWLAFKYHNLPYLVPFDIAGESQRITAENNAAARLLSDIGGYEFSWSADSARLYWTLGPDIYEATPGAYGPGQKLLSAGMSVPADTPEGQIAFTGGKVVPIVGDVIEDGTVVVEGNRILAVGPRGTVEIPASARQIDISGKVIMPGFFDAHGHVDCCWRSGTMPQKQPTRYAALAYGVTTNFDPYSNDLLSYESAEMTQAGELVGPRWLKSGQVIHGLEARTDGVYHPLASLEDARNVLKRRAALGPSILKSYKLSTRIQRQRLIQAAREQGFMVDGEGAGQFYTNIGMLLDGHTNLEHNLPVATYYDDLQQLIAATDTSMTPTLIVVFGELFGENFIYENEEPWKEEKVRTFIADVNNAYNPILGPGDAPLSVRAMHSVHVADEIYDIGFRSVGRSVAKLIEDGVTINVGSHGQASGIAMHWEMLLFAESGIAPMDILKAATLNPAKTFGLDHQLGSIEPGKLADLIVLDEDPTVDIRNANSVSLTMVNGRLYDAHSMDEIGNYDRPRSAFYWEKFERNEADWKSTWTSH
jgi:Tol biopolymer transport system component